MDDRAASPRPDDAHGSCSASRLDLFFQDALEAGLHVLTVDPGLEYASNPVDFRMTSDEFFLQVSERGLSGPPHARRALLEWDHVEGFHEETL